MKRNTIKKLALNKSTLCNLGRYASQLIAGGIVPIEEPTVVTDLPPKQTKQTICWEGTCNGSVCSGGNVCCA
jgi:fructose-bisphosphate aldolase class 1